MCPDHICAAIQHWPIQQNSKLWAKKHKIHYRAGNGEITCFVLHNGHQFFREKSMGKNENLHNGLEIAEVATWILRLVTAFQKGKEAGHYRLY